MFVCSRQLRVGTLSVSQSQELYSHAHDRLQPRLARLPRLRVRSPWPNVMVCCLPQFRSRLFTDAQTSLTSTVRAIQSRLGPAFWRVEQDTKKSVRASGSGAMERKLGCAVFGIDLARQLTVHLAGCDSCRLTSAPLEISSLPICDGQLSLGVVFTEYSSSPRRCLWRQRSVCPVSFVVVQDADFRSLQWRLLLFILCRCVRTCVEQFRHHLQMSRCACN